VSLPMLLNATGNGVYVVNLVDYAPSPRFGATPWTSVQIEEAAANGGPGTVLATANLTPLDTDPANPHSRDFTLVGATLPAGWYRVTFIDADGNLQPTAWVLNGPSYMAARADVERLAKARTRDRAGNIGQFNDETPVTAADVDELIVDATASVAARIGTAIPDDRLWMARRAVALKAAMLVELAVTPEQTSGDETAYGRYEQLFNEAMASLELSLNDEQPGVAKFSSVPVVSPTMTAQNALLSTTELLP
jgi:hypothetical protein